MLLARAFIVASRGEKSALVWRWSVSNCFDTHSKGRSSGVPCASLPDCPDSGSEARQFSA